MLAPYVNCLVCYYIFNGLFLLCISNCFVFSNRTSIKLSSVKYKILLVYLYKKIFLIVHIVFSQFFWSIFNWSTVFLGYFQYSYLRFLPLCYFLGILYQIRTYHCHNFYLNTCNEILSGQYSISWYRNGMLAWNGLLS